VDLKPAIRTQLWIARELLARSEYRGQEERNLALLVHDLILSREAA